MLYPNGSTNEPAISSNYGPREPIWTSGGWTSSFHYGTDYVGVGTVRAIADGVVRGVGVLSGWGGAGNQVLIEHDGFWSRSFHLASTSVSVGQRVSEGQGIGVEGSTGNVTGKHLHLQIHVGGTGNSNAVDPRAFIAARLGGGSLSAQQRRASAFVNRRVGSPSTSAPTGEGLPAGTVGNFTGWIRGESVDGNNVWFRGISGDWFWSGGFDGGADTSGLEDLNPATLGAKQRKTTTELRGRAEPTTTAAINQVLPAGTVGDFDGWRYGEAVGTENRWLRGAHSGDWFSLAYLEPRNTDSLDDLNPKTETPTAPSNQRTVAGNSVNGRTGPSTKFPIVQSLDAGTVGTFNGYAKGETVEGVDMWFRGAINGNWFWAGAFTSQSTDGLTLVTDAPTTPSTPSPVDADNPRGLTKTTPVYPGAAFGLDAPLGDGSRATKGTPPVAVPKVGIDRYIVHHTGATGDQLDYFSYRNDRSSCPTWYLRTSGQVIELIRPGMKPAATGPDWNYRSVAVETQNATGSPEWKVTDAQLEAHARMIAWLASYNGRELDGVPVDFTIDRAHVISHREALPGSTECPGDYLQARLDQIVARAKEIYAAEHPETPTGGDTVPVERSWLQSVLDKLKSLLGAK